MNLKVAWSKFKTWGFVGVRNYVVGIFVNRHNRRRLRRLISKAPAHPQERGITVIADLTGRQALSKTMRDFVMMLRRAGIPCQTYDTRRKPDIPESDYTALLTPSEDFDFHRYTHTVELFKTLLPDDIPERKARIAFHDSAAGVRETLPFLDSPDAILAMSDFNADCFRAFLPRSKVYKIVYPLLLPDRERTPRDEVRRKYGIGAADFVAFFNFDFGSYYRKNPGATMQAFAKAFSGDATAKLVFKTKGATSNAKQARELTRLADTLGISDQFIHISQYLPRADVDGLTSACDVYISLHKSEGFGLGMAEAMSQGKPVVATNWSANTEFCKPETAWCIPYRLVPILPHEYPVEMKEWAAADVEAAAAALREIRSDPSAAAARAACGAKFIKEYFTVENFKRSVEAFLDDRGERG